MPLSPKKCWGKKVIFTPRNIVINWEVIHRLWRVKPVRSGNQWARAAKMVNTAPVLRT